MTIAELQRFIAPLQRRVMLMFGRGIVETVKDDGSFQKMQLSVFDGEVREGIEKMQHYGFSSRPKPGSDALIAFMSGNRDHGVVIATEDTRVRVKNLKDGEVVIYTDEGDSIFFKRGKIIKITAQTKLEIDTPELTVTGKITAQGVIEGSEVQTAAGIKLGTHKHPYTDTPVGPSTTQPPIA